MTRIVISTEVAGFVPERTLLHGLFHAHSEAFEEPWAPEEFGLRPSASDQEVALRTPTALLDEGKLRFFKNDAFVRALPWLVAEVERRQGRNCVWRGGTAKVVEVPAEVQWHIWEDEDGSEYVREAHRVWR